MKYLLRFIYLIIICISISNCTNFDTTKIPCSYALDKTRLRDTSIDIEDFIILSINPDMSFNLRSESGNLIGQWNAIEEKDGGVLVKFKYNNDGEITGLLKGNIFYFEYPNEFHLGKYNDVKYIRIENCN